MRSFIFRRIQYMFRFVSIRRKPKMEVSRKVWVESFEDDFLC